MNAISRCLNFPTCFIATLPTANHLMNAGGQILSRILKLNRQLRFDIYFEATDFATLINMAALFNPVYLHLSSEWTILNFHSIPMPIQKFFPFQSFIIHFLAIILD